MLTGAPDLDDVSRLQAADVDGLLRTGALAGAQVRAVAESVGEGVLAPLADLRPARSSSWWAGGQHAAPPTSL